MWSSKLLNALNWTPKARHLRADVPHWGTVWSCNFRLFATVRVERQGLGTRKAPRLRVVVSHPFRKMRGMDGARTIRLGEPRLCRVGSRSLSAAKLAVNPVGGSPACADCPVGTVAISSVEAGNHP